MFVIVGALLFSALLFSSEASGQATVRSVAQKEECRDSGCVPAAGRYVDPGEAVEILPQQANAESERAAKSDGVTGKPGALVPATVAIPLLVAVAPQGIVTLNQNTGTINFCVGYANLNNGVPFGRCKRIGAVSASGLAGNVHLDATSNYHAFVTNMVTGSVLECYLGFNTGNGVPSGSCISLSVEP